MDEKEEDRKVSAGVKLVENDYAELRKTLACEDRMLMLAVQPKITHALLLAFTRGEISSKQLNGATAVMNRAVKKAYG